MSSSNGAALSYDPLGRLYQVTLGANTTQFLYDGDALVEEYGGAGTRTRRYAHWVGSDVPLLSYAGEGLSQPSYLHADQQGSIIMVSDQAGNPSVNRYDEYGIPAATNVGRFQYTGQALLTEIGMYYYRARIYSPTLGRFLQTDQVGYEGGINLYAYVGNDPVNRADPSGNDAIIIERPNGDVEARLPVLFWGNAVTPDSTAAFTASMQSLSQNIDGTNLTVTVVPITSQDIANGAGNFNRVELNGMDHIGGINRGHSYVDREQRNEAHIRMRDTLSGPGHGIAGPIPGTRTEATKGEATGAHYAGHLMGLTDTGRTGNGAMDSGPGRALTRDDLNNIRRADPPGSGVRNRIIKCPGPEPECQ